MERLLSSAGYRAAVFGGGAEFLDSLGRERPACVLVDGNMPGMDGREVLDRLSREALRVPVIVVSGRDSAEDRRAAAALGAIAFFSKPFDPEALLQAIAAAVSVPAMSPEELEGAKRLVGYDAMPPAERAAFDAGLAALRGAQRQFYDAAVIEGGLSRDRARLVWSKVIAFAADVILRHERTKPGATPD